MVERSRLVPFERIHIVGVGGAGMSGLAKLLVQAGHKVTGSDLKPGSALTALRSLGAETWTGHQPEAWDAGCRSDFKSPEHRR